MTLDTMRLKPTKFVYFFVVIILVYFTFLLFQPEDEYGPSGIEVNKNYQPIKNNMIAKTQHSDDFRMETLDFYSVIQFTLPYGFQINRIALVDPGPLVSYENSQAVKESHRKGLGENGAPVELNANQSKLDDETFGKYGYSVTRSQLISLNRTVPDTRDFNCKGNRYHQNLPSVSIILPFHNEAKTVLLRSATSIINRSPEHLIKEVFFVDDQSNYPDLFEELEKGFAKISPKVKVVRSEVRVGLIQARTLGVEHSTADVLIFLDSHIEVNKNWLPPLLHPIARNYRAVTQPTIDAINEYNFEYKSAEQLDGLQRGSFDWFMNYKRLPIPEIEQQLRASDADPFYIPVQCGGLFAIHRKWWDEIKGYDPHLAIWGAEQYEMSFKTWMCHGEMLEIPCSRVAHLYRGPMTVENSPRAAIERSMSNMPRIAHVWMDQYKEFYFERKPDYRKAYIKEGIEERFAIREQLQCNSFDWFMKNVAFDQPIHYPAVEPGPYAHGKVRSQQFMMKCIVVEETKLRLSKCENAPSIEMTWRKEFVLQNEPTQCLDLGVVFTIEDKRSPGFYSCHKSGGHQFWKYNSETRTISAHLSGHCLTTDETFIFLEPCDDEDQKQKWVFDFVDMNKFRPDLWPIE